MINLKTINTIEVQNNLQKRGYYLPEQFNTLALEEKECNIAIEAINAKINKNLHNEEDKKQLKALKEKLQDLKLQTDPIIHMIPNLIHETVPNGKGEEDNILVKEYFNELKAQHKAQHGDLGKKVGLDIETGVDLAHARFNVMRGDLAKLNRKLINLALDFYTTLGYEEFYLPNLVNTETMFGTGQYPKFKEELFTTEGNTPLFLIPTGEVPLTNVMKNKMLKPNEAEQKLMTHTPCFRKEAGAYGKDTKGILRQHQFEKVELVRTCLPENGLQAFEEMVHDIEQFILKLKIPFRIIELCAGDIGFAGHKAYDFELWFPTEQKYREIATVTWCHDFQARRMNTKVKYPNGKKEYLHTLNGTGLAVGRVLAALLENYPDIPLNQLEF